MQQCELHRIAAWKFAQTTARRREKLEPRKQCTALTSAKPFGVPPSYSTSTTPGTAQLRSHSHPHPTRMRSRYMQCHSTCARNACVNKSHKYIRAIHTSDTSRHEHSQPHNILPPQAFEAENQKGERAMGGSAKHILSRDTKLSKSSIYGTHTHHRSTTPSSPDYSSGPPMQETPEVQRRSNARDCERGVLDCTRTTPQPSTSALARYTCRG
jgi:hypothetical protein